MYGGESSTGAGQSSQPQLARMNPRLAQCYYALPDLEHVKYAIDTWFQHELVNTRSYVTQEEMYDLYDRVNNMEASSIELAFLYVFLIAAGAASLTQTSQKSKSVLESMYSIKSARKFAGIIFELIALDQYEQQIKMQQQQHPVKSASTYEPYNWLCLAKCPTALLHCRLHSMLCCFFHQARDEVRSVTHGNHAIRFARKYGLFDQIEEAKQQKKTTKTGGLPSTSQYSEQHIYALQRIQFDITAYPRLSMSLNMNTRKNKGRGSTDANTFSGECILLPSEACQDPSVIAVSPDGKRLPSMAFDFQCLKLILSEIRATSYTQLIRETQLNADQAVAEEMEDHLLGIDPNIRAEARRRRRKDQAYERSRRAIANDDVVLALMDLLPSWTKIDVKKNWMEGSSQLVFDATSIINMLWSRYACNRLRTDNLMQTCEVEEMSAELQCRALASAQDTIYLLMQVKQLLRTPFQFASAREWLFAEAEWAINVYNRIMEAEIYRELNDTPAASPQQFSGPPPSLDNLKSHISDSTSTVASSSPHVSSLNVTPPNSLSRETSPSLLIPTATSSQSSRRSSADKGYHEEDDGKYVEQSTFQVMHAPRERRTAIGLDSTEHLMSMHLAAATAASEAEERKAREQTYRYFAWFIFDFKGIYSTMQDLHCFGPAAFEASRTLLRIQAPPKPMTSPTLTPEKERALLEEMQFSTGRRAALPNKDGLIANTSTAAAVASVQGRKNTTNMHSASSSTMLPSNQAFAKPAQRRKMNEATV
ncbi:uncharacterized protein FA14DRAFT_159214 [Meira miltonrushii]|uniref:Uncharacterized protein n=1 Tax=Meira miltonrushii TaxID=1280837 RepID=A0A316VGZ9_9BASI|nr:uncharacterized protein FA14DRAFT_159214 [Meira miltonrushii]PWN36927.1 hypothetical protein FA14DRAFT_159214 [Meira miltonrushii]